MTDDEMKARAAIQKTLAAVGHAGDSRKADAYAACFAEDGALDLGDTGGETYAGRETIRAWMGGSPLKSSKTAEDNDHRPPRHPGFVSHHLTTCRIDLTGPDTADVRTYWLVTSAFGLDHNGYYDDRFRKVGEDWLLEYRRPRVLWVSPESFTRG